MNYYVRSIRSSAIAECARDIQLLGEGNSFSTLAWMRACRRKHFGDIVSFIFRPRVRATLEVVTDFTCAVAVVEP